jgi:cytoskeletal protein RodZ
MTVNTTDDRAPLSGTLVSMIVRVILGATGVLLAVWFMSVVPAAAPPGAAAQATATAVPTAQPTARPTEAAARQDVLVQSVPAGEAPQPVQFQPAPAPAIQPANAPAVEPAPRPLIIVHQTSADGAHQVITGSGACKVAKVAARCSK